VFRSRAGNKTTLDGVLEASKRGDDEDLAHDATFPDNVESEFRFVSSAERDHRHNTHWLPKPRQRQKDDDDDDDDEVAGPSRYVAYCDAASLYPSSGKK